MHINKEMEKFCKIGGETRKKLKLQLASSVFWLFIPKSDSTVGKKFYHKGGNFKLSISKNGKISIIHVQENKKCQS